MYANECECERCRIMCQYPCCGTVEEMRRLIQNGYGDRLMLDSWQDAPEMLKPALKGYENQSAPWDTGSIEGCTFWKDGKCELHALGLKPLGGRIATHDREKSVYDELENYLDEDWETQKADEIIEFWVKSSEN